MSAVGVRKAIKSALQNGRITKPEFQKIAKEAERDGRVSISEERLIRGLSNNHYADSFTPAAQRESDSFFARNDMPLAPPRMSHLFYARPAERPVGAPAPQGSGGGNVATQAAGGPDGGLGRPAVTVTTLMVGEES